MSSFQSAPVSLVVTFGGSSRPDASQTFGGDAPLVLATSGPAPMLSPPADAIAAVYWIAGHPHVRALLVTQPVYLNGLGLTDAPLDDGATVTCGSLWFRFSFVAAESASADPLPADPSSPWAARIHDLTSLPGRLYAVVDAARSDETVSFLKRCGLPRRCLYEGWAGMLFGPAAPYLLRLRHRGLVLPMLLREGWGRSWGIFLKSTATPEAVYRQLQGLLRQGAEVHGTVAFRFYDPLILHRLVEHEDAGRLSDLMGCIDYFAYESREAEEGEGDDARAQIAVRVCRRPLVEAAPIG